MEKKNQIKEESNRKMERYFAGSVFGEDKKRANLVIKKSCKTKACTMGKQKIS